MGLDDLYQSLVFNCTAIITHYKSTLSQYAKFPPLSLNVLNKTFIGTSRCDFKVCSIAAEKNSRCCPAIPPSEWWTCIGGHCLKEGHVQEIYTQFTVCTCLCTKERLCGTYVRNLVGYYVMGWYGMVIGTGLWVVFYEKRYLDYLINQSHNGNQLYCAIVYQF